MKRAFELVDGVHADPEAERERALAHLRADWRANDSAELQAGSRELITRTTWWADNQAEAAGCYMWLDDCRVVDQLTDYVREAAWAAVVCLSPPEEWQGDMELLGNEELQGGIRAATVDEPTVRLPMHFNRMMLFDPTYLRAHSRKRGGPEDGWLAHIVRVRPAAMTRKELLCAAK